jgi:hypothetical protein
MRLICMLEDEKIIAVAPIGLGILSSESKLPHILQMHLLRIPYV